MANELYQAAVQLPPFDRPLKLNFSKQFFKWGLVEAHPTQVKVLALINRYHSIDGVINHTDMEDPTVIKVISELIENNYVTTGN